MSIASVIRDGIGHTPSLLLTLGFGVGAATPIAPTIGTTTSITTTTCTVPWTDNSSDELGFRLQVETPSGAANWTNASGDANPTAANVVSFAVTGITPGAQYRARLLAFSAAGDSAWSTGSSWTQTGATGGTLTLADFKYWTGTPHAGVSVSFVKVFLLSSGGLILELTDADINSGSDMIITDFTLSAGSDYMVFGFNAAGTLSFKKKVTAT